MAFEIERKFLVRSEAWRRIATAQASIRQAYLTSGERSTTRVRIKNGTAATLTIKSKQAERRRLEVECPISVLDAEALMALRHGGMIEKTRFTVPWHGHEWEVDVFAGENAGLVIAEIELRCDELKQSMAQGRQISFECNADDVPLSTHQAVSMGLIVNELVTNAIKHAFPNNRRGCIRVGFEALQSTTTSRGR
jgi:adenylate cyclase